MGDVNKQLERAKKFLEKNRIEDAIDAYLAVLEDAPVHPEATQALAISTRARNSRNAPPCITECSSIC